MSEKVTPASDPASRESSRVRSPGWHLRPLAWAVAIGFGVLFLLVFLWWLLLMIVPFRELPGALAGIVPTLLILGTVMAAFGGLHWVLTGGDRARRGRAPRGRSP